MTASRPRINLLVLRSADLDRAVNFYAELGLHFVPERHGDGPQHYSCLLDGFVLEIFRCGQERPRMPSASGLLWIPSTTRSTDCNEPW